MSRLRLLLALPFPPDPAGVHGGARVTGALVNALAARHDVTVLHLEAPRSGDRAPAVAGARCEGVPLPALSMRTADRVRAKLALARGEPVRVRELQAIGFARRLRELAAGWEPDVVQVEFMPMAQYLPALAGLPGPGACSSTTIPRRPMAGATAARLEPSPPRSTGGRGGASAAPPS